MGADVCSALVPAAPAETEDFGVDVEASEETVRAGQPFNVTCTGPPGPGFQQQWLHPKSQARPLDFFQGNFWVWLLCRLAPFLTSVCHVSVSLPSRQSPNLKLPNNGFWGLNVAAAQME